MGALGFRVYPNPNEGRFTIESDELSGVTYAIMDVTGKLVQQGRLLSTHTALDLSHQASGIYLLQVGSEGAAFRERIVVR
ncbi:MAG: T9SS type A sorting domain-containing protein [Flavobacteriales bacterium]|nr:T9SS type A sorting domain-containing protein [Flavobacteriales bacterium]